ncbi:RNA polymerase sigma factor [Kangiella shandongensis]|uniref:RNA polymerase sigma factor n=1 Tax=Kangiella shandongensis TaxID=2763258 RepID=UPI001CBC164B|nr:RNA polymerase sigma factor [Kangiella shandongensis]
MSQTTPQLEDYCRKSLVFAVQLLGNQSDAEDVVQSSIEKVLAHPKAPKSGIDLQKWLYRVVRNAAIDRLRQRSRETTIDDVNISVEQPEQESPERQLEREQIRLRLSAALKTLAVHHRELVVLRDYHGHSYDDIAEILSIPKGTVMSRLHRARLALREALNNESKDTSFEAR